MPKRQVLLSERAALFREMAARLSEGDVVEGVINKVVSYGAFVNLKDADGHMGRISVRLPLFLALTCDLHPYSLTGLCMPCRGWCVPLA